MVHKIFVNFNSNKLKKQTAHKLFEVNSTSINSVKLNNSM